MGELGNGAQRWDRCGESASPCSTAAKCGLLSDDAAAVASQARYDQVERLVLTQLRRTAASVVSAIVEPAGGEAARWDLSLWTQLTAQLHLQVSSCVNLAVEEVYRLRMDELECLGRDEAARRMAFEADALIRHRAVLDYAMRFQQAERVVRETEPVLRLGEAAAASEAVRAGCRSFDYLPQYQATATMVEDALRADMNVLEQAAVELDDSIAEPELQVMIQHRNVARRDVCTELDRQLCTMHGESEISTVLTAADELERAERRCPTPDELDVVSGVTLQDSVRLLQRTTDSEKFEASTCVGRAAKIVEGGPATADSSAVPDDAQACSACRSLAGAELQRMRPLASVAAEAGRWRHRIHGRFRQEEPYLTATSGAEWEERLQSADAAVAEVEARQLVSERRLRGAAKREAAQRLRHELAAAARERRAVLAGAAVHVKMMPELLAALFLGLDPAMRSIWSPAPKAPGGRECTALHAEPSIGVGVMHGLLEEAELLLRLQHRNVEAVQQLSAAGGLLCYRTAAAGKRLRRWFAEEEPSDGHIREVVRGFLHALAHLEAHGVAHGRVRPSVLRVVEEEGQDRAVLCDLRLERGARTADCGGDGEGEWEEGLPEAGEADVQALGRSLLAALPGVGSGLVQSFKELAGGRLSADGALKGCFAHAEREERATCVVCKERFGVSRGVTCSASHFKCGGCVEQLVLSEPVFGEQRRDGELLCGFDGCTADPFHYDAVAAAVGGAAKERYAADIRRATQAQSARHWLRAACQDVRPHTLDCGLQAIDGTVKCPVCARRQPLPRDGRAESVQCACGCKLCLLCGEEHYVVRDDGAPRACCLGSLRVDVLKDEAARATERSRVLTSLRQWRALPLLRDLQPDALELLRPLLLQCGLCVPDTGAVQLFRNVVSAQCPHCTQDLPPAFWKSADLAFGLKRKKAGENCGGRKCDSCSGLYCVSCLSPFGMEHHRVCPLNVTGHFLIDDAQVLLAQQGRMQERLSKVVAGSSPAVRAAVGESQLLAAFGLELCESRG
eukprot:TRINITY_DN2281_c0_g2_i3.p1 TRINITY_DN2281_c0_g2~~TRINITY_DN2281_c0_g2_i3.p1  ORF type:complete len:1043 (+),score=338.28 TRINITY_DN2281_c0_g2_i3:65-3130(+)